MEKPDLLVKLRPTVANGLKPSSVKLAPLFEDSRGPDIMGVSQEPEWFALEIADSPENAWDLAHSRIADQLGIAESDIIFAEPDVNHSIYRHPSEVSASEFAASDNCDLTIDQDDGNGKEKGDPAFGWHLADTYSQLRTARDLVEFSEPRTRIAHLDTGYFDRHKCKPKHIVKHLERNFVKGDASPWSSEDPNNKKFLVDNSGHGTGTIGILAGGGSPDHGGEVLGGAPEAEVLPLRIADRVILLRTSSFAQGLQYAVDQGCAVVTMSMGGLPSELWNETINSAYLKGVCVVAAAGNNVNKAPTRNLVYPARYDRVIAACGVMANGKPYANLSGFNTLEGNYGPDSRMRSAIAAYTPNIPWPVYPCETNVRLDGEGTSAATPQVAAAAALWLEKYKGQLPRDWRRVEAVRHALFSSAKADNEYRKFYGNGILKAANALQVRPFLDRPQTKANSDSFAFLRVITGLGISEASAPERMFNLEIAQLWFLSEELQALLPNAEDGDGLDNATLKQLMEHIVDDDNASLALRRHVASRYTALTGSAPRRAPQNEQVVPELLAACESDARIDLPPYRRLKVFAVDPSLSTNFATVELNEAMIDVRWESLDGGLIGEYLEIDDVDATGRRYDTVDLNAPSLLAQNGFSPSEGNPQFHQQMVYAVAMKTIEHFERSLGRPVLWRTGHKPEKPHDDSIFVPRLLVRPHAVHQANAFYSPAEIALKFGYFESSEDDPGEIVPGSRIYTCLSHDIIAHETTHAVLDGMYRRFNEPSNPDVLALHEAFADIIALMQHFTMPEVLRAEIARTRGDIEAESLLGGLAMQFGKGLGHRGALRNAIGQTKDGLWIRTAPDASELSRRLTPHSRGAILVAAVFDAFITIFKARIADLLRIYTGGTGILPNGAIHPDLVNRLSDEANKSASHVLNMCIRALDYLPPVDVTFFEYLRALITADFDLIRDDRHNYRVAFIEAFRRRGIHPGNVDDQSSASVRNLSVDSVRWKGPDLSLFSNELAEQYEHVVGSLKSYADACLYVESRKILFEMTRKQRRLLHKMLKATFASSREFAVELGIDPDNKFEIHALRPSMRLSSAGGYMPQVTVAITQSKLVPADNKKGIPRFLFRSGSTLIVDLAQQQIKYKIIKNLRSSNRQTRTAEFHRLAASDPLKAILLGADSTEPFALLHQF